MGLFKSGLSTFFFRSLSKVLSFVAFAIFSRIIAPNQLGAFFLFQSILGFIILFSNFGISDALEKRITEGENPNEIFSSALWINMTIILALALPIWIAKSHINDFIGANVTIYLLVALLLYQGQILVKYFLRSQYRISTAESLGTIHKLLWIIIGYLLVEYSSLGNELIIALTIAWLFVFLYGLTFEMPNISRPSRENIKSMLNFSLYSFVLSITGFGFVWIDTIIIGLLLQKTDVAIYEIGWRVASVFTLFGYALAETTFPWISKWESEDKIGKISSVVSDSVVLGLIFVIPGFVGAFVIGDVVLSVVFGELYGKGSTVLIILMTYQVLSVPGMIFLRLALGLDRPDVPAKFGIVAGVINIALNFALIPLFELSGAAIATTVAFLINLALITYWLRSAVSLDLPKKNLAWSIGSAVTMGSIIFGVRPFIPWSGAYKLGALLLLGVFVYGLLLSAYSPLRTQMLTQVKKLSS
jgi:O-antigen/teichoic acid export membrane protein